KTHTERALAVLQQLARRVVDRRDVVGVKGVSQTEGVGERSQSGQGRLAARVPNEQAPADEMQERDGAGEGGETSHPFRRSGAGAPRSARRASFQAFVSAARSAFDVGPSKRADTPQPFGNSLTPASTPRPASAWRRSSTSSAAGARCVTT